MGIAHHVKELSVLFLSYSVDELQDITQALIYLLKSQPKITDK